MQTDHRILVRRPDLVLINKKRRIYFLGGFTVSTDHRVKVKKGEKLGKYLNLARGLKKLLNI